VSASSAKNVTSAFVVSIEPTDGTHGTPIGVSTCRADA